MSGKAARAHDVQNIVITENKYTPSHFFVHDQIEKVLFTQGFCDNCQKTMVYSDFWHRVDNICKNIVQDFFRERLYAHLKFDLCNFPDCDWSYTQMMMAVLIVTHSPQAYRIIFLKLSL